jgi:hypothetical protein
MIAGVNFAKIVLDGHEQSFAVKEAPEFFDNTPNGALLVLRKVSNPRQKFLFNLFAVKGLVKLDIEVGINI